MQTRDYETKDHAMLEMWWSAWGWPAIPEVALSTTGIIVHNKGVDVACCFIYKTDSCVCWIEHYLVNKEAPKAARGGAIDFLIDESLKRAKDMGFVISMSSVNHKGLINKLVKSGYSNEENNMSNMVRFL